MFELISDISLYSELIPVIFYILFHKRINDNVLRVIFLLLIGGIIFEIIGLYSSNKYNNNIFIWNFFTLIETLLLTFFFHKIFENQLVKKITLFLSGIFLAFWGFQQTKNGFQVFDETSLAIEQVFIIAFSIYYLFEQLKTPESTFVYTSPRFWVVIAYFIYMSATFFLFLFLKTFSNDEKSKYLILNSFFIIIKIILLSVAMFMRSKQPKTKKFHLS